MVALAALLDRVSQKKQPAATASHRSVYSSGDQLPLAFISRQFGLALAPTIPRTGAPSHSSLLRDSSSGSLAMLTAIGRASSRVSTFACRASFSSLQK